MSDYEPTPPGDPVDPDEIPETDLSDFESQVVEQFNAREAQSSAASDEVSADASPSPGSEAAAPANTGAALDFVEPVDDGDDDPSTDDTPVWSGVDDDQQLMARTVYDWYTKLDGDAIATVDAALSGEYVLVPNDQIQLLQQNWDRLNNPQQPVAQDEYMQNPYYGDDDEDGVDPQIAELQQRLEYFEDQQAYQQVMAEIDDTAQVIDHVWDQWKSQHNYMTEEQYAWIEDQTIQTGVYEALASRYPADQAARMAFDQILYGTPELREMALGPVVDERVHREMMAAQEQAQRGMRASAVAGSSPHEPDMAAMSPEEAMIEEIRRSLEGM
jgi:hypothetical protein